MSTTADNIQAHRESLIPFLQSLRLAKRPDLAEYLGLALEIMAECAEELRSPSEEPPGGEPFESSIARITDLDQMVGWDRIRTLRESAAENTSEMGAVMVQLCDELLQGQ